jgi:hypothetical protein
MAPGSTLTQKLTVLGVQRPAWPEEPVGQQASGDLILQGLRYAEGVRLWRAQLRSALTADQPGKSHLLGSLREAAGMSSWDQAVMGYVLIDLQDGSGYDKCQAAARLVGMEGRTAAQLLGASLVLAGEGWLASAVHGIRRTMQRGETDSQACLEICALMLTAFQPIPERWDAVGDEANGYWTQAVQFQLEVTRMLAIAASHARGEASRDAVLESLENLQQLAGQMGVANRVSEQDAIQLVAAREQRRISEANRKPLLRTIHHLACSGGTVISKCLAAMPQVALISEVNPLNRDGCDFEPTNPMLQLERSYRQLTLLEIKNDFLRQIGQAYEMCRNDDVDLILRDHSHSDFCLGEAPRELTPICDFLTDQYELVSVVTVRHPLDSFLGLAAQGWHTQFTPSTLEEYSRRYLAFLDRYRDLSLRRYEAFCADPEAFMQDLCELLELEYSPAFLERFGSVRLSGGSGRGSITEIKPRPRRPIPEVVQVQLDSSGSYRELLERLGYGN